MIRLGSEVIAECDVIKNVKVKRTKKSLGKIKRKKMKVKRLEALKIDGQEGTKVGEFKIHLEVG